MSGTYTHMQSMLIQQCVEYSSSPSQGSHLGMFVAMLAVITTTQTTSLGIGCDWNAINVTRGCDVVCQNQTAHYVLYLTSSHLKLP